MQTGGGVAKPPSRLARANSAAAAGFKALRKDLHALAVKLKAYDAQIKAHTIDVSDRGFAAACAELDTIKEKLAEIRAQLAAA